ncbi:MAG TPA: metallophosphoesterase family protein [Flavobacteriales bacterium]|nr:metallophosphoesterase family protein [Flavobacteriales bacterium]
MMRIGLLSDTHGWLDPAIRKHIDGCDELWHAGDIGTGEVTDELKRWKPLRAVYGNIDGTALRQEFPEHQRFTIEQVRVWMTHIGGTPPRYNPDVLPGLKADPPTVFICGHSHICKVQFDPTLNTLYMNPGAAGRHGWHQVRTLLRFTIVGASLKDLEVIELGKRSASLPEG